MGSENINWIWKKLFLHANNCIWMESFDYSSSIYSIHWIYFFKFQKMYYDFDICSNFSNNPNECILFDILIFLHNMEITYLLLDVIITRKKIFRVNLWRDQCDIYADCIRPFKTNQFTIHRLHSVVLYLMNLVDYNNYY